MRVIAEEPEAADVLAWFAVTHELATTGFGASWRLAWLPGPGPVGAQDARLLEALAVVRQTSQAVLVEAMATGQGEQGLARWRSRVVSERA